MPTGSAGGHFFTLSIIICHKKRPNREILVVDYNSIRIIYDFFRKK